MVADDDGLRESLLPDVNGRRRVFCCHSATLSGQHAPNSFAAVRECIEARVPRLEVDVRFTADDAMVCFHDAELDRLTTGSGAVGLHTAVALRAIQFRATSEPLCFLEDVVELVRSSSTILQVDLKLSRPITPARVRRLEDALEPLGDEVIVGSQSPWNLRRLSRVPVAFDPTLFFNYTSAKRQALYPRQRGLHGFWDDSPLALNPHASAEEYLRTRIEELQGLVPAAVEWMVDIGTILRMAELGVRLGDVLAASEIGLAAWTLSERDPLQSTLDRIWEAGTTTVITDVALAVSQLFRKPSESVARS